jgi:hypothetical protein
MCNDTRWKIKREENINSCTGKENNLPLKLQNFKNYEKDCKMLAVTHSNGISGVEEPPGMTPRRLSHPPVT